MKRMDALLLPLLKKQNKNKNIAYDIQIIEKNIPAKVGWDWANSTDVISVQTNTPPHSLYMTTIQLLTSPILIRLMSCCLSHIPESEEEESLMSSMRFSNSISPA